MLLSLIRIRFGALRMAGGTLLLLLTGCAGADLLLPGDGVPAQLRAVSGDGQTAIAGTPVRNPLVVEALDASGVPVPGAVILFEFVDPPRGAEIAPPTPETNADGQATVAVTLGSLVGDQPVEARLAEPESDLSVRFLLTAIQPNGGGDGDDDDDPPPDDGPDDGGNTGGDDDEGGDDGGGGGGGGDDGPGGRDDEDDDEDDEGERDDDERGGDGDRDDNSGEGKGGEGKDEGKDEGKETNDDKDEEKDDNSGEGGGDDRDDDGPGGGDDDDDRGGHRDGDDDDHSGHGGGDDENDDRDD